MACIFPSHAPWQENFIDDFEGFQFDLQTTYVMISSELSNIWTLNILQEMYLLS